MSNILSYLPLLEGWRIEYLGVPEGIECSSQAVIMVPSKFAIKPPSSEPEVTIIQERREKGWLLDLYFEVEEAGLDYLIIYLYLDDVKYRFQPRRVLEGPWGWSNTLFGVSGGTITNYGYGNILTFYMTPPFPYPYKEKIKMTARNVSSTTYNVYNPIIRRIIIVDEKLFIESAKRLGLTE